MYINSSKQCYIRFREIDCIQNKLLKSIVERVYRRNKNRDVSVVRSIDDVAAMCQKSKSEDILGALEKGDIVNDNDIALQAHRCISVGLDPVFDYFYRRYQSLYFRLSDSIYFWTKEELREDKFVFWFWPVAMLSALLFITLFICFLLFYIIWQYFLNI